jgi:MFS family permease
MVQASGSSSAIALSVATVADIATSAQRGKYNGYATAGILFGPAFGPTIGGLLAQYLGWRAIFWFLAIFSFCFLLIFIFIFPETCRNVVGNGSIRPRGISMSVLGYLQQRKAGYAEQVNTPMTKNRKLKFPNPWHTLKILGDKESALLLGYNALAFSAQMVLTGNVYSSRSSQSLTSLAALPSILQSKYDYNELKVGLCYLPNGFGALVASILTGYLMDWNFRRHAKIVGLEISRGRQQDLRGFPLERARVEVIVPYHFLTIVCIILFGWITTLNTSIAGPLILLFCLGFSITAAFNVSNAFLIDLYRDSPATATAAVNLTRCLVSAAGVALIVPLINAIGRGWAFSIVGFLEIALTPLLYVLVRYGPKWREAKFQKKQQKVRGDELPEAQLVGPDESKRSTLSEKPAAEEV